MIHLSPHPHWKDEEKTFRQDKLQKRTRADKRIFFTEKLVLVLRDGRKMIGVLRSWDQFGKGRHVFFEVRGWKRDETDQLAFSSELGAAGYD